MEMKLDTCIGLDRADPEASVLPLFLFTPPPNHGTLGHVSVPRFLHMHGPVVIRICCKFNLYKLSIGVVCIGSGCGTWHFSTNLPRILISKAWGKDVWESSLGLNLA